jgi:hypothetical protein
MKHDSESKITPRRASILDQILMGILLGILIYVITLLVTIYL